MREIVLLCSDSSAASNLKAVLSANNYNVLFSFRNCGDALSAARNNSGGLLICCGISPSNISKMVQLLPVSWDMIVLLRSGQSPAVPCSQTVYLNLPLNRQLFLKTVEKLCAASSIKSSNRNDEIIIKAKTIIMKQNLCSESEAYRILRTESMNSCKKITQTAEKIISLENNKPTEV